MHIKDLSLEHLELQYFFLLEESSGSVYQNLIFEPVVGKGALHKIYCRIFHAFKTNQPAHRLRFPECGFECLDRFPSLREKIAQRYIWKTLEHSNVLFLSQREVASNILSQKIQVFSVIFLISEHVKYLILECIVLQSFFCLLSEKMPQGTYQRSHL